MKLTSRQDEIFRYIKTFMRERGYSPSVREIGKHFGIYPRAVFDHLKALERKGYLRRRNPMSRGLEIRVFQESGWVSDSSPKGGISPVREIPVVGRVMAGKPILAVEQIEGTLPLPADWVKGEEVFLLKVKGDSMSPFLLPEDYVVVRSQSSAEHGEVVVALMGEEATVKRFFRTEEGVELRPDNQHRETIRVEAGREEPRILGKVIGVFRRC